MSSWTTVCQFEDLIPNTGVCALHNGEQVAIFLEKSEQKVYAISNYDPIGKANVLSRGIVADVQGTFTVASPLYKQHFALASGECLEEPENSVKSYDVRVHEGEVQLAN
ncbi:nitrite reductase small subunit [Saccharobesus litoralis]|uniref:Nitrite reductase (NADH) small subunit n=1 Tax=Saccharobesus litoralis TaxID=2172099 RepID=A0A2S0VVS2_9ALTE|nr:nitrite reductase small subunit NirD [Saccharobesus litoralis]AWB68324.1 nitrite reductase small subunit [Saccharobesus litoralis]